MDYNYNQSTFMEKLIPVFHFQELDSESPIIAKALVEAQVWTTKREFMFHERVMLEVGEVRIGSAVNITIPKTVRWTSVTKPAERLYKVYRNWESPKAKKVLNVMDIRLCELLAPDHLVQVKEYKLSLQFFKELNEFAATVSVIKM